MLYLNSSWKNVSILKIKNYPKTFWVKNQQVKTPHKKKFNGKTYTYDNLLPPIHTKNFIRTLPRETPLKNCLHI